MRGTAHDIAILAETELESESAVQNQCMSKDMQQEKQKRTNI